MLKSQTLFQNGWKAFVSIALVAVMLFAFLPSINTAHANPVANFDVVVTGDLEPGGTIEVAIYLLSTPGDVIGLILDIGIDPTIFYPHSGGTGGTDVEWPAWTDAFTMGRTINAAGRLNMAVATFGPWTPIQGTGRLVTLTLNVRDDADLGAFQMTFTPHVNESLTTQVAGSPLGSHVAIPSSNVAITAPGPTFYVLDLDAWRDAVADIPSNPLLYTTTSWAAITAAQAMPRDTLTQFNAAVTALNNAIAGLDLRAPITGLADAIAAATGLTQANFTADSWAAMITARNAAQDRLDNAATTVAPGVPPTAELVTNLNNAVAGLISLVDLNAAIAAAQARVETDYTPNSWAAADLAAEIVAAQTVAANPSATAGDIADAIADLNAAMALLAEPGDASDLDWLIGVLLEANALGLFTADSWALFVPDLAIAQAILGDAGNFTQAELDDAYDALLLASLVLVSAPATDEDRAALRAAIDALIAAMAELDEADFTEESWAEVLQEIAYAEEVYADPDATRADVFFETSMMIWIHYNLMDILVPIDYTPTPPTPTPSPTETPPATSPDSPVPPTADTANVVLAGAMMLVLLAAAGAAAFVFLKKKENA